MKKYSIIFLVLSAENHTSGGYGSYTAIINAIKETWGKNTGDDILVLYYYGKEGSPIHLEGNDLICSYHECVRNIGLKTLQAFDYVLKEYDFDYVVRCCAGSYFQLDNLKKHLQDKPKQNFCCGIEGMYHGIRYVSGSCYAVSKDVVKKITQNGHRWCHNLPDDVALGKLVSEAGIPLNTIDAKRVDLNDHDFDKYVKNFKEFNVGKEDRIYEKFEGNYHIHFRNIPERMYQVHNYFEAIHGINRNYDKCCNTKSDINEHLPILLKYAEKCKTIIEFGVREGVSTWAFLKSHPEKLLCVDIKPEAFLSVKSIIDGMAKDACIDFEFIEGDALKIDIPRTDMLFIDTLHVYEQLKMELNKHGNKVDKYIVVHDTETYARRNEIVYPHASEIVKNRLNTKGGLMPAIEEFLKTNGCWQILERCTNNNGLIIMEKR